MDAGREPPRSAGLAFVNIFSLPEAAICKGASACCADWLFVVFGKALLAIADSVPFKCRLWVAFVANDGVSGGFPVERAGVQVGRLRGEVAPLYSGCTTPKLRDSGIYKNILLM